MLNLPDGLWFVSISFKVYCADSNLYNGCNLEFIPFQFTLSNLCSKDRFVCFICDIMFIPDHSVIF